MALHHRVGRGGRGRKKTRARIKPYVQDIHAQGVAFPLSGRVQQRHTSALRHGIGHLPHGLNRKGRHLTMLVGIQAQGNAPCPLPGNTPIRSIHHGIQKTDPSIFRNKRNLVHPRLRACLHVRVQTDVPLNRRPYRERHLVAPAMVLLPFNAHHVAPRIVQRSLLAYIAVRHPIQRVVRCRDAPVRQHRLVNQRIRHHAHLVQHGKIVFRARGRCVEPTRTRRILHARMRRDRMRTLRPRHRIR